MTKKNTITFANFGPTLITTPLLPSSYTPGVFFFFNQLTIPTRGTNDLSSYLTKKRSLSLSISPTPDKIAYSCARSILLLTAPAAGRSSSKDFGLSQATNLSLSDLLPSKGSDGLEMYELKHFKSLSFWTEAFPCLMYDYSSNSSSNSFSKTVLLKK